MSAARVVGGALLGLGLGFGAVRALGPLPAPPPVRVPGEPIVVRPQPDCPDESGLLAEVGELQATLAKELAALTLARDQEEKETGAMLDWPDDVDERYTEAAIEAHLEELAAEYGATIAGLDCGEFPCVAMLLWPGNPFDEKNALEDELRADFEGLHFGGDMVWFGDEGPPDLLGRGRSYAFHPHAEPEEAVKGRLNFRLEEAPGIFGASEQLTTLE